MTDIDTLRETEVRLRATDNSTHASLRKARHDLDNVRGDDREAYATALLAGGTLPKARAVKLRDQIRDYEVRVIPGIDEALWMLARQVRETIRPDLDPSTHRTLDTELRRWQPPDTYDPSAPAPERHLAPRPDDIVQWVVDGIARLERFIAEQEAKAEVDRRKKEAYRRVQVAQGIHDRAERQRIGEWADAHQFANMPPGWPIQFDRKKFLEDEGLLEDYDYVEPRR